MSRSTVFDLLAADYDASFSHRLPARWLRQRVRDRVGEYLPREGRILDVGCGTGDDTVWLARQGHTVVATDVSARMLEEVGRKLRAEPREVRERVSIVEFDAACDAFPEGLFDVVWSDFGALNCVEDLDSFLDRAADSLCPDGLAALVLMGQFCLWETLGFAVRGDLRRATRRWSGHAAYSADGISQDVWYHSASKTKRLALRRYDILDLCGIGVFVPSTEYFGVCERRPALFRSLATLEARLGTSWPLNRISDHYLIVLRRARNGAER